MRESFLKGLATVFGDDHLISSAPWEKGVSDDFGQKIKIAEFLYTGLFWYGEVIPGFFVGFHFICEKKHVEWNQWSSANQSQHE